MDPCGSSRFMGRPWTIFIRKPALFKNKVCQEKCLDEDQVLIAYRTLEEWNRKRLANRH